MISISQIKFLIFSISGIIDLFNTFMEVNYASITISAEERIYLKSLIRTRTIQAQVVDRARMLLWKSEAKTDKAIADNLLGVEETIDEFSHTD